MSGSISTSIGGQEIRLFLCKPNRQTIAELSDSYNINHAEKLGKLNELSFNLPFEVDIHNELRRSRYIDNLKDRYLIRMEKKFYYKFNVYNDSPEELVELRTKEWFIINQIEDIGNSKSEIKKVQCFSLAYELQDKMIDLYETEGSLGCVDLITDMLEQVTGFNYLDSDVHNSKDVWSVESDEDFNIDMRNYKAESKTLLEIIFDVAKKYNAVVVFDTEDRVIKFKKPQLVGHNHTRKETVDGVEKDVVKPRFSISYGQYLKKAERESVSDEMVTRLRAYGKDEMTISDATATGAPYLEDFSFFMYPFQRDDLGNVNEHSDYMSDSLCHALLDYKQLVHDNEDEFDTIQKEKKELDDQMSDLLQEKSELATKQYEVENRLDVKRATDALWYGEVGDTLYANFKEGYDYVIFKVNDKGEWYVDDKISNYGR